jgi:nitroreductase
MTDTRVADHEIAPIFTSRWSPRAFTGEVIDDKTLHALFEAARWAPSANNSQPWRFVYAKRDSASWPAIFGLLNENNRVWAAQASALLVLLSKTTHVRPAATEATPLYSHSLDAGAAWASLAFQAEHSGWRAHAIGGFDRVRAKEVLGVPDGYRIEVAVAIGRQADRTLLSAELQQREQPNQRKPVAQFVAEGRFAFPE